jgi:hypothetical protein
MNEMGFAGFFITAWRYGRSQYKTSCMHDPMVVALLFPCAYRGAPRACPQPGNHKGCPYDFGETESLADLVSGRDFRLE